MNETLRISEIYRSVQGESSYAGLPCTFVRLTGCHQRCVWCDSAFTFHGGETMTLAEIAERVERLATPLVEITGGEPLLQPAVHVLLSQLADSGYEVLLETSGSLDIGQVDPRVVRIVDLKCPASGECHRNNWDNLRHLRSRDEVKFVIADRADYEWARAVISEHDLATRAGLLMGTVHGALEPQRLAEWLLEDRLPVRFQLQLHKSLWPADARGV